MMNASFCLPMLSLLLISHVAAFARPQTSLSSLWPRNRMAGFNKPTTTIHCSAPHEIAAALIFSIPRGGQVSDDTLAQEAFDWTSHLGSPAALVAGAVLATLSQTRPDLAPLKEDKVWIRAAKKLCRALLLSSFAFEVFCIFVTTVTGTMLLSHGDIPAGQHAGVHYHSPMGFLVGTIAI